MTDYAYPISIFPWRGTRLRNKGTCSSRCFRDEISIMREKLVLSRRMRSGRPDGCRALGLLNEGIFTNDDDILAYLDSLLDGRLRPLLFKQPFDIHGADRLISERQPPLLLRAGKNQRIQRIRESAGGSLDEVVPD